MITLSLELVNFLVSERAKPALDALSAAELDEGSSLRILTDLRKHFSPTEAAAILDQAALRQKAGEKFPRAGEMLFTDEALQQASSRAIAAYHAEKFSGYKRIADLGSGIGGDAIAFAGKAASLWCVEVNPLLCRMLEHNLTVNGCREGVQIICADWRQVDLREREAVFIDPARRREGKRVFRLAEMQPSISAVLKLQQSQPNIAVKVAPGIAHEEIPSVAETEFISEKSTLKEALLLFGGLRSGAVRTATILPAKHHMVHSGIEQEVPTSEPLQYIYEPDPAVIRAALVRALAKDLDACQLDASIAYLTSDHLTATPFARAWRVMRHGPFNLKNLNHWLREMNAGEVVVKKRGSPIEPDAFRKRLKTARDGQPVTVFITRCAGKPWMLIAVQ